MKGILAATALLSTTTALAYPVDGYEHTGIRRVDFTAQVHNGTVQGKPLQPGQYLLTDQVQPRLLGRDAAMPALDADLTAKLQALLNAAGYSTYSVALIDLSDPAKPAYAATKPDEKVNVGSVGKVMVALALMQTLADLYPNDNAARERVLRETIVTADEWSQYDHHTVTFWDPVKKTRVNRTIRAGDKGTLWEYLDWMLSASSNSAAGMVQKELIALKHFGTAYPPSPEQYKEFFAKAKPKELGDLYKGVSDDAARRNGFDPDHIRQASIFTRGGKTRADGAQSYANTGDLARYLYKLETGQLVDEFSSREIKRLLYMTQRRIRYASHPALNESAVYFKSGSYYQCFSGAKGCPKYRGDKTNRLASVAIIESPAERQPPLHYLVAVTSNVLKVNSAVAHQSLALRIHRLIEAQHPVPVPAPVVPDSAYPEVPVDDPETATPNESDTP